jgi:DNA-binding MarR family transcriptional regulator
VMSISQLHHKIFPGRSLTVTSRRIRELWLKGFLERRFIEGQGCRPRSVLQTTPKALKELADSYRYAITAELCKSDSVRHDLALVDLRFRLERLKSVTDYFTENMLQACAKLSEREETRPFVQVNSDAAIEVTRKGEKFLVGLEYENSEKAKERYVRKLVSYYSDGRTPVILYVCESARIRSAIVQAEAEMIGKRPPRCHYSLLSDVLASSNECTFEDMNGAKIVLA